MSYKLDNIVDKTNDKTIANDNKADDNYQILEASKVLQLALQQMDGIIASCDQMMSPDATQSSPDSQVFTFNTANSFSISNTINNNSNGNSNNDQNSGQQKLLNQLLSELNQLVDNKSNNSLVIDKESRRLLIDLLQKHMKTSRFKHPVKTGSTNRNIPETDRTHEKLEYLENERQQLILQMGIMSEKIESQNDKIESLEDMLDSMKSQLIGADDRLQQSLQTKSTLENTNLDLMSEMSKLKIDLDQSDHSKINAENKARKLENELSVIRTTLLERETEISALRLTLAKMARTTGYLLNDGELSLLRGKSFVNDFRNRKPSSELRVVDKPPIPQSPRPLPNTPPHSEPASRRDSTLYDRQSPSAVTSNRVDTSAFVNTSLSAMARSSSAENMKPEVKPYSNYSTTLPHLKAGQAIQHVEQNEMNNSFRSGQINASNSVSAFDKLKIKDVQSGGKYSGVVSFGKNLFRLKRGKRSSSAPNLAKDDQIISSACSSTSELHNQMYSVTYGLPVNKSEHKPKGLKRIFSRAKRSPSSASGLSDGGFTRGGIRSTSGPRLGYSVNKSININLPFSRWDTNLVADWFAVIGLGMYSNDCKRWCKNGEHLLRATAQEVEKELGIRNALHRKKLRLAVSAMNQDIDQLTKCADQLDYLWVARWLDDIGLPQYKDAFLDARIDGRVLHYLTVEDLFSLKITSQLHHASIRAGIKSLREQKFDPQCLIRRAAPEETKSEWNPSEIALWTSHRVMEWLRSIDLSEYAPNLRGSGVHGALIVSEHAFNADLFATLLSIPASKTLLRRHISIKFKQLIGNDLCRLKRNFESHPNYVAMVPGAKIKPYRRGHFSLLKKRKFDVEFEDYVCPMNDTSSIGSQTPSLSSMGRQNSFSSTKSTQSYATEDQKRD